MHLPAFRETDVSWSAGDGAPGRALGQPDPPLRSYCKKSESQSVPKYFRVRRPTGLEEADGN